MAWRYPSPRWRLLRPLLLGALVAGCGSPARSAPTPTLAALCVRHVEYWALQAVSGQPDQGLDYQEMGLVAPEYAILSAVLQRHPTGRPALARSESALVTQRCTAQFGSPARHPSGAPGHFWPTG